MSRPQSREARSGLILVNVLFIVALSALVVLLMVSSQSDAIDRTVRLREASQAGVIARSGELSAVTALRRDAATAPETDNSAEPWAAIREQDIAIEGGTFSLTITDDQARFNLNTVANGGLVTEERLGKILAAVGLRPALRTPIIALVRASGPLANLDQLSTVGLTVAEIAALRPLITVLPLDTSINLNTADERMIAVLFDSPMTAGLLVRTRQRNRGVLTPQDLARRDIYAPPGVGFTSNFFRVTSEVQVGDTRQRIVSSLIRQSGRRGPEVLVYARRRTAAASK
ncbi:hypothetical protein KOAAANKH_02817 [Brevundimonas sp. NIBR10]|uniref:general secretion pathway protein GspK n=1 Tax=Brevundimonas sp. NIBR10 TaxID=3015997 RepID=UPI0022F14F0E|nr:type II secretion system protein GspK [Brevundimonas sp. NIBR10]WGM47931.1 hypothetical protein KOAAANKH_02817 [Brevundimonas sp. NIBR10]